MPEPPNTTRDFSILPLVRRSAMWLVFLMLLALIALCIYGSFQHAENWPFLARTGLDSYFPHGAEGAQAFFNSLPMAIVWICLALLMFLGFFLWKSLRIRLGALTIHLGALLVLLGSLISSEPAHKVWRDLFRSDRVFEAEVRLQPGQQAKTAIIWKDREVDRMHPLDFTIQLNEFEIEYHPWRLKLLYPEGDQWQEQKLSWQQGQWKQIPRTPAEFRVRKFVPEITEPLPPRINVYAQDIGLITLSGEGATRQVGEATLEFVDYLSGPNLQPVGKLSIQAPQATRSYFAYTEKDSRLQWSPDGILPVLEAAVPPNKAFRAGYMDLNLRLGGQEVSYRLRYDPLTDSALVRLDTLFPNSEKVREFAFKMDRTVKDYLSDLSILDDGEQVRRKTIEVNDPLHYGGYHIYQMSKQFRPEGATTILSLHSDRGWPIVALGLIFIMAGSFWQLWLVPGWRWFKKRRAHGA